MYTCVDVCRSITSCTVYHFIVTTVHTLCLAQFGLHLNYTYKHLWRTHCAWISSIAVHLYFSPVYVHSGAMCTNVHLVRSVWLMILQLKTSLLMCDNPHEPCRPITGKLGFTCFALIGPIRVFRRWT